jgi:hypothetical protein
MDFLIECMDDLSMEQQKVCVLFSPTFYCQFTLKKKKKSIVMVFCLIIMTHVVSSSSNSTTGACRVNKPNKQHGFRREGTILSWAGFWLFLCILPVYLGVLYAFL